MLNQMEYKCPACGGALAFDSVSQQLKCPFCESIYDLDSFESIHCSTGSSGSAGKPDSD